MKSDIFNRLISFLGELEQRGIGYHLDHHRDEALMVLVAVPGERWEIEFLDDGSVEIEIFVSSGEIHGENILHELFARYANDDHSESAEEAMLILSGSKAA